MLVNYSDPKDLKRILMPVGDVKTSVTIVLLAIPDDLRIQTFFMVHSSQTSG